MKLSNGREVFARRYQESDAEAVVNLIRRNFLEVNVKDYGEKAMKALAEDHDVIEFYQAVGFRQTRRWMEYEVE